MYASTLPPTFLTTFRRYVLYVLLMIPIRTVYLTLLIYLTKWFISLPLYAQFDKIVGIEEAIILVAFFLLLAITVPDYLLSTDNRWLQGSFPLRSSALLWSFALVSAGFLTWGIFYQIIPSPLLGIAGSLALLYPCLMLFKHRRRWRLPFRYIIVGGTVGCIVAILFVFSLMTKPMLSVENKIGAFIEHILAGTYTFSTIRQWVLDTPQDSIGGSDLLFGGLLFPWIFLAILWVKQYAPIWRETRTRRARHRHLRDLITLNPSATFLDLIRNGITRLQNRYTWLPLFVLFLSPFPVAIAMILTSDVEAGATAADKIAILTFGFGLTGLCLLMVADALGSIVQRLRETRRFLMLPFKVVGRGNQEVQAIANLMTYSLLTELQRVGTLLQWRQTEHLGSVAGYDTYPMFVAAGLEHNFVEELRHLRSLEVENGAVRFPLGRFLERFIESSASVRLQGTVQQRENGAIEIWIQMTRRDSPTVSAEHVVVSSNSTADINEITADAIARDLASKLVLQISEGQPLAANPTSLQHFLAGIEAIVQRKWWLAISHYRSALGAERTAQAKYGLMHYHLGAAFIIQGDITKGREQLELAEQSGLVLPELQYMLARTRLYEYWSQLDQTESVVFDEIMRRSLIALRLRPRMPEVLHLLGALNYQRGRLIERKQLIEQRRDNRKETRRTPTGLLKSRDYYRAAGTWFKRAESSYDQTLRRLAVPAQQALGVAQRDLNQLVQTRIAITHQRADALRGQGKFIEADLAYRDVVELFPENLRNLVDIAKVYCLAGNWQYAHLFIEERLLRHGPSLWNADANFHAGWALAGGVADRNGRDGFHQGLHRLLIGGKVTTREALLVQAMRHMDFALIQRPRYLARWQQNDWFPHYLQALKHCMRVKQTPVDVATLMKDFSSERPADIRILLQQSVLWLVLRFCQYQFHIVTPTGGKPLANDKEFISTDYLDEARELIDALTGTKNDPTGIVKSSPLLTEENIKTSLPHTIQKILEGEKVLDIFCGLVALRNQLVADLIYDPETIPLERMWTRLNLALPAMQLWERVNTTIIGTHASPDALVTLAGRLKVELVAETALIAIRLLVEGGDFVAASTVVETARAYLAGWRTAWQKKFPGNTLLFSSQVFRYQLASVYAWQAYIDLQKQHDKSHQFRVWLNPSTRQTVPASSASLLHVEVQKSLQHAFELMRTHPLAMFVQAQLRFRQNLFVQAAEELQFLSETLFPFDPSRFIRRWGPGGSRHTATVPTPEERTLLVLEKMGHINGSHQFASVVNPASIHALLADIYEAQNLSDLAVEESRTALRWQVPSIYVVQPYLALARRLMNHERFREAEAVLATIRVPGRQSALPLEIVSHHIELEVLRCVLATRKGNHEQSLAMGEGIAQNLAAWGITDFVSQLTNNWGEARPLQSTLKQEYSVVEQYVAQLIDVTSPSVWIQDGSTDLSPILKIMPDVFQVKSPSETDSKLVFDRYKPATYHRLKPTDFQKLLGLSYTYMLLMDAAQTVNGAGNMPSMGWQWDEFHAKILKTVKQVPDTPPKLKDFLTAASDTFDIHHVIRTQILHRFFTYQLNHLLQIAELSNTLAYNHSELDIQHRYAFQHARYAILIAHVVESRGRGAFDDASLRDIRANLAQYHDTLGWVYYRAHTSLVGKPELTLHSLVKHLEDTLTGLQAATDEQEDANDLYMFPLLFLARDHLEHALGYDPDRAIFYYHLARTHTTNLEYKWQGIPDKRDLRTVAEAAPVVMMHLRKADRYWTRAKRLDNSNRLHTRLVWLRQRIQEYRDAWNTRQVTQFRGVFTDEERVSLPVDDELTKL